LRSKCGRKNHALAAGGEVRRRVPKYGEMPAGPVQPHLSHGGQRGNRRSRGECNQDDEEYLLCSNAACLALSGSGEISPSSQSC